LDVAVEPEIETPAELLPPIVLAAVVDVPPIVLLAAFPTPTPTVLGEESSCLERRCRSMRRR